MGTQVADRALLDALTSLGETSLLRDATQQQLNDFRLQLTARMAEL